MAEAKKLAYEPEFPHPFVDRSQYDEEPKGTWAPRAILELRMYQLSATLREKPEWWRKAKDPEIRQKWFEEAKAQQEKEEKRWRLSDNMINYTLGELEDHAQLRDEETGIECGPYECIWRSDKLIPDDLRAALRAAVAPLEDVPEDQKDWHPGSNKQVLDLVHPSLYPLVYGKTLGKQTDGSIGTFSPPSPSSRSPGDPLVEYGLQDAEVLRSFISPRFQWLPSDFEVREDGSVRLTSSYVNNVPPEHAPRLVPVLERIVARAVPLWERVLGDLRRGEPKMRLGPVVESDSWVGASKGLDCVWKDGEPEDPPEDEYYDSNTLDWEMYKARRDAWFAGKPMALPEVPGEYDGRLVEGRETFSLRGRRVQVITKLANIVLGPENPTYPGGTWHVEGMWNERIVSTFIYYYESENIQDTTLAFRQATAEPLYHQQDDVFCMWTLYCMERDRPCVQNIGSIQTKEGRCIAFPNLFQHKVAPIGALGNSARHQTRAASAPSSRHRALGRGVRSRRPPPGLARVSDLSQGGSLRKGPAAPSSAVDHDRSASFRRGRARRDARVDASPSRATTPSRPATGPPTFPLRYGCTAQHVDTFLPSVLQPGRRGHNRTKLPRKAIWIASIVRGYARSKG